MPKPKRENKSKEQLIADAEREKEIARKREILINKFYPALMKATISIDESKVLISAINSLAYEEVMKPAMTRKFGEIIKPLHTLLTKDGERINEIQSLLDVFKDETMLVASEIIGGMTGAIETMIKEEMKDRKLDTLKTGWECYLN